MQLTRGYWYSSNAVRILGRGKAPSKAEKSSLNLWYHKAATPHLQPHRLTARPAPAGSHRSHRHNRNWQKENSNLGSSQRTGYSSRRLADPQAHTCLWWWFSVSQCWGATQSCILLCSILRPAGGTNGELNIFTSSSHGHLDNTTLLSSQTPLSVPPTSIPDYSGKWRMLLAKRIRCFLDET